jgi:hypothetical protein
VFRRQSLNTPHNVLFAVPTEHPDEQSKVTSAAVELEDDGGRCAAAPAVGSSQPSVFRAPGDRLSSTPFRSPCIFCRRGSSPAFPQGAASFAAAAFHLSALIGGAAEAATPEDNRPVPRVQRAREGPSASGESERPATIAVPSFAVAVDRRRLLPTSRHSIVVPIDADSSSSCSSGSMPSSPSVRPSSTPADRGLQQLLPGLRHRFSSDDEPWQWNASDDVDGDTDEGGASAGNHQDRSGFSLQRKRRTCLADRPLSRVYESLHGSNTEDDEDNYDDDDYEDDVCDEEVSCLLRFEAFPFPHTTENDSTRYHARHRSSSPSSAPAPMAVCRDETDRRQERQRQSLCKRRRRSRCRDASSATTASGHRPSLDLYKMQVNNLSYAFET